MSAPPVSLDPVDVLKDLVRIDTSNPPGMEKAAAAYLTDIFEQRGIEYKVIEPEDGRCNVIAWAGPRSTQSSQPPIVFISHLDVVPASADEWDYPPFSAREVEGMIYGRGTIDTKYLTAMQLCAFVQAAESNLTRPLYFVASADEEQGSALGMPKVVAQMAEVFTGAHIINEGGGFFIDDGENAFYLCTAGEKGRCSVRIVLEGQGGPSSFPREGKLVDTFMQLLDRLSSHQFVEEENAVSRRFDQLCGVEPRTPLLRSFRRYITSDALILKQYDVGNAVNALPHRMEFDVDLQLLPGRTREDAQNILNQLFFGLEIRYEVTNFQPGFISDIDGRFFRAIQDAAARHCDGAQVLPVFALGQTDGRFLGPLASHVYGFAPVSRDIPFEEVLSLVHQKNEKISRESLSMGTEILLDIIRSTAVTSHDAAKDGFKHG